MYLCILALWHFCSFRKGEGYETVEGLDFGVKFPGFQPDPVF